MDRSKKKTKSKKAAKSTAAAPAVSAPQPLKSSNHQSFPIVGVGASAGGLEAFIQLLKAVPPQLGMAFVLVPHLDPSHESAMTELLARVTNLPVLQVSDGMQVSPNHVYIIPPNAEMTISGGVLHLTNRKLSRPQMLIDTFFRSLAVDQGTNAIGVILSGTATDGTLGLTAIKGEGGITFAQDSASAKYDGMPTSAIAAGCVDVVLPPAQIPRELARIHHHLTIADQQVEQSYPPHPEGDHHLGQIFRLLRQVKKVDFSEYKLATVRRRIMRRLALRRIEELSDYISYLKDHREEIDALYQDILINVTNFFRNPGAFEALKQVAYPAILKDRAPGHPIRLWVPGCSTGEETYSHAIALVEYLSEIRSDIPVQIFGTDLSETAIQSARLGIYKENIQADVSPTRLRRFFTKTAEGYQISKSIRDLCVFAVQNVFNDPPFSRMEIVSCRNVLIYLSPSLQRRVVPIFHYALNPTGFLMVGNEEGLLGTATELFDLVDRKHKIYQKKAAALVPVSFGFSIEHYEASTKTQKASGPAKEAEALRGPLDVQREADRLLLAKYVPAAVVVNEHLEILQSRGHTGRYLELAPGKASLNLLKMARPGLLFELQKAIDTARKTHTPARKENIQVLSNGGEKAVNLEVIPFRIPSSNERESFLIVFEEAPQSLPPVEVKLTSAQQRIKDDQTVQIKQELAATKEYLQSIIEAQEATNEELQSANEEIQSGNEELQSTNEELQTSKEELESANEELNTVNEEMQHRNQQLSQANNDMTNLLNSVNIPTVMLGPDLSVRRFTPQAEKILGFSASDVGRPITNLRLKINAPDMEKIMLDVIRDVVTEQRELQDDNGTWYRLRISPYRTSDNKIEGVVMTLLDITDLKQSSNLSGKEPRQLKVSQK